ncbi:MAG: Mov34/MPN/PAD-1 family protein [Pseudomonadota bacterium]
MAEPPLVYRIPGAAWCLALSPGIRAQLTKRAQRHWWAKESVGQLYTRDMTGDVLHVDVVTKLRARWASHTGVQLDVALVTEERAQYFKKGLHCLGFWHSHPESVPSPSAEDIAMAADHAKASLNVFAGILFVIVGTAPAPLGLGVWVHDGKTMWQALPESS